MWGKFIALKAGVFTKLYKNHALRQQVNMAKVTHFALQRWIFSGITWNPRRSFWLQISRNQPSANVSGFYLLYWQTNFVQDLAWKFGTPVWTYGSPYTPSWLKQLWYPLTQGGPRLQGNWLVVSTPLKNISQIGSFPQVGVKIKNTWNHHLGNL